MAFSLKILLIVAIAGIVLFMARTGIVQQMASVAISAHGPLPPAYIPKIFPFPMQPQLK
ncbi:MAG: hypothetical protein Q8P49_03910 [Candidatus Liptonbacteria bacterium]|nr:hypothetical protein [Candidatus Liptonbacteria bacterium]